MNILITGATGFIGSHLIKLLQDEKHNLFCTLLPNEKNPYGDEFVKSIIIHPGNIETIVSFLSINEIDGIIHLASFVVSGEHKSHDIGSLLNANVIFGTAILEAASLARVKWFINTGTYWQFYNNETYCPVNLYAASKQAFMDIAKHYWFSGKIKFCTLMLYDTYGPNDPRPKIFNLWQKIARTGETLDMSPGEQLIDVSHVYDVAGAFALLANHLKNNNPEVTNGDTFAVKAENRYSLKELACIFEKLTNKKLNINWGGRPYREREIFIPWNNAKVVPEWRPLVSVFEGIKQL
jgi:nucleoside-diphosphate-sugar epimerase